MASYQALYGEDRKPGNTHRTPAGLAWEISEILKGVQEDGSGDMQILAIEAQIVQDG